MSGLPFTTDEFLGVFASYNESVWPVQWVLNGVAFAIIGLMASSFRDRERYVAALLAALWAWSAVAYHLASFAAINPLAYAFALLFLCQAAVLSWVPRRQGPLKLELRYDARSFIAGALIVYALVVYPFAGWLLGHRYPEAPTFGVRNRLARGSRRCTDGVR